MSIRDLHDFNKALLLKVVWHMAADSDKLWVAVVKAKHYPRCGFWAARTRPAASKLWRAIQELKGWFKDDVSWELGEGTEVRALNEPWFQGWGLQRISTNVQRDTKVADLYDQRTLTWN